ncbi:hypothetical protein CPT_Sonora_035 [Stenotrophomonas phage Sonora]|nr:hypothetical protein CPT_Sonora_035 [Stenotrophomonas phage Sonora]
MAAKKSEEGTNQQIATTNGGALAEYAGFEEFAGSGFENQSSDDYAIPFLNILQGLSPILETRDDLKPGMLINTVTGEAFSGKDGIAFVPATTQHQFVEFKPRDAGGGFVAAHAIDDPMVKAAVNDASEFGKYSTPDGNELIETFYVYGTAVMADGSTIDCVIAFSSTKIKKYKAWMTKAKTIQIPLPDGRRIPAPLFAHRYRLKATSEKNNKGSFYNWDIGFDGESAVEARLLPSNPLFQAALGIKGLLDTGKARAAYESTQAESNEGASGDKPVF